jgi:hypothetical protein
MSKLIFLLFGIFSVLVTTAQSVKISGSVYNIHGDILQSAYLSLLPDSIITKSDASGEFSLVSTPGKKILIATFVGFRPQELLFNLSSDTSISLILSEKVNELKEVVIEDENDRHQDIFKSNQTSTHVLNKDDITAIPVLGGEADVIKTLQLLPGTVRGVEGSSDLFVRGGAADQNLVLLDGAPIYNTSHLFGFLSVFNPDVLDKVEAINGGFPARFGGRLSSILNVNTKNAIADKTNISGDVGLIASRLMIEQPLIKDKASIWIAGRRTYIDRVVHALGEELPYFFYDLNGKIILHPSAYDQFEVSYYGGRDILDLFRDNNNDGDGFLTTYESGNNSQAFSWKRKLNGNVQSNLSLIRTDYNYDIRNIFNENTLFASSDIVDYSAHLTVRYDSLFNGQIETGVEWTKHTISPNVISTSGVFAELLESSSTSGRVADEFSWHGDYTYNPTARTIITAGLRTSFGVVNNKTYFNPEPRFSARYQLRSDQALKLSYSRMAQYIHRISNSAISTPTDIWYPVTENIKPQTSHQVAFGWQRSSERDRIFFSTEAYYKTMDKLIGYEEGTNLFFNTDFESKLIQGTGRAYGLEFLIRKDAGKLTGWISYTLAWSWRRFDEINQGDWFRSRYDRRHNGAIVSQYAINKRWSVSAVWEFISGSRFTPVIGQYTMLAPTLTGVDLLPIFSTINEVKLGDTHRLDVGVKLRNKPARKFRWHLFAGVYNVYNRAAPIGITISQKEDGSLHYEQPGLFGLLPFISYGFKL